MTTTIKRPWAKAIAQPAIEFALTELPLVSGHTPDGLQGSLYRNGAARLERGGIPVGHWFDGDGAVLAVHFAEGRAEATYRYVNTSGYLNEEEAGELLYGGYGMTAPGPIWNQWLRSLKNVANTSVLALSDRLLALWEGGKPHALDLQTLKTLYIDDLGVLGNDQGYSAHPKRDAHTGDLFNFSISPGANAILNLYHSTTGGDRPGTIQQHTTTTLEGVSLVHDFVMAGPYLIFCVPPLRLNLLPALVGWQSFSDAIEWKPSLGTQILVFDRHTLQLVSQTVTEPWFQWHFSNGYVDADGTVVFQLVRFPDFQTNQYLKEFATGQTQTYAKGTLWQVRLDPNTGTIKSLNELMDRACEFPTVSPYQVGQSNRFTYLVVHRPDAQISSDLFGAIARYDHQTDTLVEADLGRDRYPSEPIYAPDAYDANRGWLVTVVFDGNRNTSEVWIFDGDRLQEEPVCRLSLPQVIPHSFHGTWRGVK